MALQVSQDPVNAFSYELWDGHHVAYNPNLVTPPRLYEEAIYTINYFFYEPGNDYLVAYVFLSIIDWPSWACWLYKWKAADGSFVGRQGTDIPYATNPGLGSYNKIFAGDPTVAWLYKEVDWQTLTNVSGGWSLNTRSWPSPGLTGPAIVNLQDNLMVGVNAGRQLVVWDTTGPTVKGQLCVPNALGYLAYQDRDSCWVVTTDGLIAKARYSAVPPRWEMLSSVQNPSTDATAYFCAFDTKRSRLVILRQRPDAADGSCQCQLEFYSPIYQAASLTDPVPVKSLRAGQSMRFVAHILGSIGEGVAGRTLTAALASPATGQVRTPAPNADLNGAANIDYQASQAGSDTLQLSVEATVS